MTNEFGGTNELVKTGPGTLALECNVRPGYSAGTLTVYAAEGAVQLGGTGGWARLQIESGDRLVLSGMDAAVDLSVVTVTFLQPTQGVTNWFLESDSGLSGEFQEVSYATGLSGVLVAEPKRYGAAIVPEPCLNALALLLPLWVPGAYFKLKR